MFNGLLEPVVSPKGQKYTSSKPDHKGRYGIMCYRTVCDVTRDIRWFNKSTKKYYCGGCKNLIERWPENANLFEYHLTNHEHLAMA